MIILSSAQVRISILLLLLGIYKFDEKEKQAIRKNIRYYFIFIFKS